MDGYRRYLLLLVLVGLLGISGASCPNMVRQCTAPLPRALPPSPTLDQVIQVVNDNNSQIVDFSTDRATLGGPGLPTLRANLAFQRPDRLRLRAGTGLSGPELDLGSNDQLFWFWVRRNQPPAIYYCRHDQFAVSRARHMIPVDPDWLIEALGITEFDPALPHQGPFALPGDRLEVRTIRETPDGPTTKATIIDAARGWVLQQQVYDAQGRLVASSVASRHRRDPFTNLVMPTVIDINCPPAAFSMRVDLGSVRINRLSGNLDELWTMPSYQGSPVVDLCDPNLQLPPATPPAALSARPHPQAPGWDQRRY